MNELIFGLELFLSLSAPASFSKFFLGNPSDTIGLSPAGNTQLACFNSSLCAYLSHTHIF